MRLTWGVGTAGKSAPPPGLRYFSCVSFMSPQGHTCAKAEFGNIKSQNLSFGYNSTLVVNPQPGEAAEATPGDVVGPASGGTVLTFPAFHRSILI